MSLSLYLSVSDESRANVARRNLPPHNDGVHEKHSGRSRISPLRVAYVHDWLVTYRGGEKVLDALLELYPDAPVYTLFYDPKVMPASITRRDVRAPTLVNAAA